MCTSQELGSLPRPARGALQTGSVKSSRHPPWTPTWVKILSNQQIPRKMLVPRRSAAFLSKSVSPFLPCNRKQQVLLMLYTSVQINKGSNNKQTDGFRIWSFSGFELMLPAADSLVAISPFFSFSLRVFFKSSLFKFTRETLHCFSWSELKAANNIPTLS